MVYKIVYKEKYFLHYNEVEIEDISDPSEIISEEEVKADRWWTGYLPNILEIDKVVHDYLDKGEQPSDIEFEGNNKALDSVRSAFYDRGLLLLANGKLRRRAKTVTPIRTVVLNTACKLACRRYGTGVYVRRSTAKVASMLRMIEDVTSDAPSVMAKWQESFSVEDVKRIERYLLKEKYK